MREKVYKVTKDGKEYFCKGFAEVVEIAKTKSKRKSFSKEIVYDCDEIAIADEETLKTIKVLYDGQERNNKHKAYCAFIESNIENSIICENGRTVITPTANEGENSFIIDKVTANGDRNYGKNANQICYVSECGAIQAISQTYLAKVLGISQSTISVAAKIRKDGKVSRYKGGAIFYASNMEKHATEIMEYVNSVIQKLRKEISLLRTEIFNLERENKILKEENDKFKEVSASKPGANIYIVSCMKAVAELEETVKQLRKTIINHENYEAILEKDIFGKIVEIKDALAKASGNN